MRPLFANLALASATTLAATSLVVFHPRAAVANDCVLPDCKVVTVDKKVLGGPPIGTQLKIFHRHMKLGMNLASLSLASNPWWQKKDYAQHISYQLMLNNIDWPVYYDGKETNPEQTLIGTVGTEKLPKCVKLFGFVSAADFSWSGGCDLMKLNPDSPWGAFSP